VGLKLHELTWRERGRLWLRLGIRLALVVLVVFLLARVVPPIFSLFMPFVLALVMAWILNPVIRAIQRRVGLSRKLLSLLLLLLLLAVAGGALIALVYSIVAEVASLLSNWPVIWQGTLQPAIFETERFFSDLFEALPDQVGTVANHALYQLVDWLNSALPALATRMGGAAGSFAVSIPAFVVSAVIFIMASFFITSDYPRLRFLLLDKLSGSVRSLLSDVKETAVAAFGGYVKAQLILSAGVFVILLLGFGLIGQPYVVLLAFFFAVLDFVPLIGSGTIMIPWAAVDLLTGEYRHAAELLVIWGIIALFRRMAEPKILGDQTGLSPILSLASIYVGMQVAGVGGMILGPVLCLIVLNIYRLGIFEGSIADLRLAAADLSALLQNRPGAGDEKAEEE
jgi:sporulation integral membrane protein YtvI